MKPVSKTAFYCCGVRMQDAKSEKPLINDQYAERLMGPEGLSYWEGFKPFALPNGSNIARAYLIDNHLRSRLSKNPDTTVILIGAGLDSRAFRLKGGHWIELDEPGVIDYKNERLPVSECPNSLQRISIDFEKEELSQKLIAFANTNPVVIVEGVLMYLTQEQRSALFQTLAHTIGQHTLLCDLMTKRFFDRMADGKPLNVLLAKYGAHFKDMLPDPGKNLEEEFGYRIIEVTSSIVTASENGLIKIPKFIVAVLFRKLFLGYSVYKLEYPRGNS